ncbi:hypothetical protein [Niabella drilacis]|uniref:DUF3806 domain-containing protein n=1 Tax=Niabella drilacis (strain DSM 25811 / CCM 8410 / CCUG 62505 / LMG 26954 / E90) TaxID=1285928 RepID=A0A1G6KR55_NIADE|nr:hypothetical protein [Niabella drilacis]SDC32806.1 hypothetical protein SAMN04487894_10250 [Niabella drilacis]
MDIEIISSEEQAEITALNKAFLEENSAAGKEAILSAVYRSVDLLKHAALSADELNDRCFKTGAAYGTLIRSAFGWDWFKIKNNNQFAYAVCTPGLSYGIQVFHYFNLLLTTDKVNNTVLLFNMIRDLNDPAGNKPITFLV